MLAYGLTYAALLFAIAWIGGWLVLKYDVRVNYTRKINHFAQFLLPTALFWVLPYAADSTAVFFSTIALVLAHGLFIAPIRSRVPLIATMFASFDRPEDRPYTLVWLVTQVIASIIALIPLRYYAGVTGEHLLPLIPVLINGFGDGLAEPVGVRFGRHRYKTRGLFVDRTYERSLEGSACVLIASILTLIFLRDAFDTVQWIVALIVIPPVMTLTEARAPHTWDAPLLYLVGGTLVVMIKMFV